MNNENNTPTENEIEKAHEKFLNGPPCEDVDFLDWIKKTFMPTWTHMWRAGYLSGHTAATEKGEDQSELLEKELAAAKEREEKLVGYMAHVRNCRFISSDVWKITTEALTTYETSKK